MHDEFGDHGVVKYRILHALFKAVVHPVRLRLLGVMYSTSLPVSGKKLFDGSFGVYTHFNRVAVQLPGRLV